MKSLILLCRWWGARNKENAGEKRASVQGTCRLVLLNQSEYDLQFKSDKKHGSPAGKAWIPPPPGVYKLNTDAAFNPSTGTGGWGFIARDEMGNFLEGGAGKLPLS